LVKGVDLQVPLHEVNKYLKLLKREYQLITNLIIHRLARKVFGFQSRKPGFKFRRA